MLRLPPFRFVQPGRLEEATARLADEGSAARVVAGGTDLWPNMKRRHQTASTVISLLRIPGLEGIQANGELTIGATTRLDDVVRSEAVRRRYPALARAVASISSPPLRNMGTLGGNLCLDTRCTYYNQTEEWRRSIDYCLKEEGTVCWVAPGSSICWAHSASDSAPVLAALDARVRLAGVEGEREIAVDELFRNDGIDYLTKRPEEILTEIRLPPGSAADRCRSSFWKLRRRGSIDFAVLSVAVAVWTHPDGTVERARIYLGSVASRPVAAEEASRLLVGTRPGEETVAAAARAARKVATPMDNTDFQTQWRGVMAERYAEAALREALGLERRRALPAHPM
ncbi:MAG: FAD binding domain-containing protein [Thermoanaerobaculia bacterium]|nr:FAD binding domain-containing protein [Thermoanaerobaculia bacterium]